MQQFIAEHVSSVAQLEVLLLMHGEPDVPRTADDLAESLRIDRDWAAAELKGLHSKGLVAPSDGPPGGYCYMPHDEPTATAVDALAKVFSTHRVSVITLIFSKPDDAVASFADAFKLRKDDRG
ncbi:MAG: hypothetical protein GEU74_07855 [Nitriliruptorales bacterium]|nr:hypothetical protein [Nitriliruptorales bacterium]